MSRSLTPRQRKFVKEYLVDRNLTQAAIRTGYSKRSAGMQASRLMKNDSVRHEVEKGVARADAELSRRLDKSISSKQRWLEEVAALGYSDVTQLFSAMQDGKLNLSLSDIKARGLGNLIRKVKLLPGGKIEFEMHAKLPALELLAKHFGWIKDQVEHSGSIASSQLIENDFKRVFADPKVSRLARELAEATSQPSEHQEPIKAPEKGTKT